MSRVTTLTITVAKSLFALTFVSLLVTIPANGQTFTSVTDGSTPSALTPGAPTGSYALTGFENINLYNGNLNFALPIIRVGGRGGADFTMMLSLEQHWRIRKPKPQPNCELTGTCDLRFPWPTWWASMNANYGPGTLQGRKPGVQCGDLSLTRLTFSAPGGTEFELRDQASNGQPLAFACGAAQGASRGTVFVTSDGSAATFVSDTTIFDNSGLTPTVDLPSGYLMLRDGTRYRIDQGLVTWIRDRNGNKLTFTYSGPKVISITDSLNRQINIAYSVADVAPYGTCDQITFKGFRGEQRTIRVSKTSLANALRTTQAGDSATTWTFKQLFPDLDGSATSQHNPTVVSSLWLPDGQRRYRFYYNVYSELARVELPTGGAIEYDFADATNPYDGIFRRVTERRVYADGVNLEGKTTYSNVIASPITVDVRDGVGALLARSKHYFNGNPYNSLDQSPTEYSEWKEGREYKTEVFASNGTTLLRQTQNTWQQRAAVSWWTGNPDLAPPNDPRISEVLTTLADTNQVSKRTFGYDDSVPFNNQNSLKEYDFGSGAAGVLLRETRTTYLTSSGYTGTSVHLRSLPTQVSIFDGGGIERARTTYEYDSYILDGADCLHSFHCSLTSRSNISGFDALFDWSYTTRGNATSSTRYLLTNGAVTGSVPAYSHYDVAGNVVRAIYARSTVSNFILSSFEYDDRFGSPDTEARSNTAQPELSGLTSFAVPTKITNPAGHTVYTQFDYYLGRPVNSEDANGIVASGYFDDDLDRPTQIRRGIATAVANQTSFSYDDVTRIVTTTSDLNNNNDNRLVSKVLYDGLGRITESRQYEGGSNYVVTKRQYDALGRVFKISNPFRPWESESPIWTTTVFDGMSRVTSVTTPDSAVVSTTYSGDTVTVTDQAGKSRKSVTDALGRLTEIYEDPDAPGGPTELNYQTTYDYDVSDNLVGISQGSQQRFFMYDSLNRLIRSRNPEQSTLASLNLADPITGNSAWSNRYEYDANGNPIQQTDARGVVSTYAYDALNRNTTIDYSDTASINPDVSRFYDGATNGKGKLWYGYAGGGETAGSNVEKTLFESYDVLGRLVVLKQLFKVNGVWSTPYQISRAYNLAGGVTSQTYPSNHTVAYNYDSAGRLADVDAQNPAFTGNLGDGVSRTYSSGIAYVSGGQLKQEQFGTTTPVYNKLFYNSRQQLAEVLASTTGGDSSWNRGKILNQYSLQCSGAGCSATDNNGNLRKQEVYVPANDQVSSYTSWYQQYDYDALNRLLRVHEYTGNPGMDWQQEYVYDRWGNRRIHQTNTFGTGINKKDFTVSAANNQLAVPVGQSGTMGYDDAGNLTTDTYTGYGTRVYNAENKMTSAQDNSGGWSYYTYNADGQRTRRKINNQETWQIYGLDGELIAEYAANGAITNVQREYGYRNGQLLVTAEPAAAPSVNVASASNGAMVTASSAYSGFAASGAINGDRKGLFVWQDGYWATASTGSHWLEVQFNGSKTISEIDVVTTQDNYNAPVEPTEAMTFSNYGLTAYQVQYWTGSAWANISGASVTGNNKVWRKFTFAPLTTTKIRVSTSASPDGFSRLTEVEAWTGPSPAPRYNLALGATATASSSWSSGWGPDSVVNGDRKSLNPGNGGAWVDAGPAATFPDWVQVDFGTNKIIEEIDVFTLQDNYAGSAEPTEAMTFTQWGLTGYQVQYWDGSNWVQVPGASVTGNNKIWRKFVFSPLTTNKIRVLTSASVDGFSRLTEIEAYAPLESSGASGVHWLITDHLGTPRMVLDQTGALANMTRHDYLPFGEELYAGSGLRTVAQGYAGDGVRQQFTQKERDTETGLDFFVARYYSAMQGRFTGVDPLLVSTARLYDPQGINLFAQARNNPLKYIDTDGKDLILANNTAQERGRANIDARLRADERANIRIVGNKVVVKNPKAIDLSQATNAYRGLVEVIRNRKVTVNYYGLVPGQSEKLRVPARETTGQVVSEFTYDYVQKRGGLTVSYLYNNGTTTYDSYIPVGDDNTVDGLDGTPVPMPETVVFYHEAIGHSRFDNPGTVQFENLVRQDTGVPQLPARSGFDHEGVIVRSPPETLTTTSINPNDTYLIIRPLRKPN
jgi:RHS repeat-associated protein